MTRALIVVDLQNDFCEGGSLPVDGGGQIAWEVSHYLQHNHRDYALVVASKDFHHGHDDNSGHFSDNPDFVDTWPKHCVADSHGSNFHPSFQTTFVNHVVYKGEGFPAYSAFEGATSNGQALVELLREAGVRQVDVCGIATDYCVKATAMDSVHENFETTLLSNLTVAVGGPEAVRSVSESLGRLGVIVL